MTYRDRDKAPSGVEKIVLRSGRLTLKGSGRLLSLPPMPSTLPLVVQLQGSNGGCLGASYAPSDVRKNEAGLLRGRGR